MIGLFDSGVGGLSILRDVYTLLPKADYFYFGDTANAPYGTRPPEEIKRLSLAAMRRVIDAKPEIIIVACNTATSIAIRDLRAAEPDRAIVGVVPVVKTLTERTRNHRVSVVATQATFSSQAYQQLKSQFAGSIDVQELAAPGWVTLVEQGRLDLAENEQEVQAVTDQVKAFESDTVALGCTHFPFLRAAIEHQLPGVAVLDSGPAVARQVARVLTARGTLPHSNDAGTIHATCSGTIDDFRRITQKIMPDFFSRIDFSPE